MKMCMTLRNSRMNIQVYFPLPPSIPLAEQKVDSFNRKGGKKILTRVAGKDASKQFWKYHNEGILKKFKPKLQVGSLDTKAPPTPPATPPPAEEKKEIVKPEAESGAVVPVPEDKTEIEALEPYGDLIPFADPSWYQGVRSHNPHIPPPLLWPLKIQFLSNK
jgi:hypothetical protein